MGPIVLVVEQQADLRAAMGGWLRAAGFDVRLCSGPSTHPECPNGTGTCPLAESADIVVVDLSLADDDMLEGPPGWQLLESYLESGMRVVALANAGDFVHPSSGPELIVVPRPPERTRLIEAALAALETPSVEREMRVGDLAVVRGPRRVTAPSR